MTVRPLDPMKTGPGPPEDEYVPFDVELAQANTVEEIEALVPEIKDRRERSERRRKAEQLRRQDNAVRRADRKLRRASGPGPE